MTKKPNIVLLEDDLMIRGLMSEGLADDGYTVTAALGEDGLAAELDRLEGRAILVADRDIGNDAASGFDIAAAALERFPTLKVIYVSGTHIAVKHRQLSPRERSMLKPFAISQLVTLVKQLS